MWTKWPTSDSGGYKNTSDYTDNKYLLKENNLLRDIFKYARHSTYCNVMLFEKGDCNCGYSEVLIKWLERNIVDES